MNTYREDKTNKGKSAESPGKKKKGHWIQRTFNGEFLAREGLINHLPFILFLAVLFLLHISLMYYFERVQHTMAKRKNELNEIRSAYNTTMSDLERKRQQSSVAEEISSLGLRELRTPPQVIDVEKGFLNKQN
jgi:hypothetical protein